MSNKINSAITLCLACFTACVSAAELSDLEALAKCQEALKRQARDPEKAEVPYVPNMGGKGEYYYAWGRSTKMMRMRNGLGNDVATTGSCIVNAGTGKIVALTLDGKTIR